MSSRASERPAWPRRRALLSACTAALLLLAGGCMSIQAPPRFLVIGRGTSELKAITPDEARLWVREFNDWKRGDLGFWAEALRNDFTGNRGYTLIEEQEVQDAKGRNGLELRFEAAAQGQAQGYLVTLFVLPGWMKNTLRVAEFVAPKPLFDGYLPGVRQAITTISR
jgi:hypothetical protein